MKESAGTDIRAFVVGGRVVASMKRQSLDDDFRSNLHKGGEGTKVKLTEEERKRLANFPVGQGLFFAGQNHVHIQIIASETETGLISTNPQAALLQQAPPGAGSQ